MNALFRLANRLAVRLMFASFLSLTYLNRSKKRNGIGVGKQSRPTLKGFVVLTRDKSLDYKEARPRSLCSQF